MEKMPRVIYLIALENIFGNAIFENQVRKLLLRIQGNSRTRVELTIVCLLPWFEITRRGGYSNFRKYRGRIDSLRQEFSVEGVGLEFIRTLMPSAFFNMGPVGLAWLTLCSVPALLGRIIALRAQVVHCRYYYAAFLALVARKLVFRRKVRVIFDVRSLLPEQGIVNRRWSGGGPVFRFWKAVERWMFFQADRVVSVSPVMTTRLEQENSGLQVETIPNFVDLNTFRPDRQARIKAREALGIQDYQVLVYSGTLGGRYPAERVAQSAEVFFRAFGPEAFFLVLTSSDEKRLAPLALALNKNGRERGKHWQVQPAPACEVPRWLAAGDWALLVLADNMTGVVQPIKFAEYLAVGLPVLTHPANSELVRLVAQYRVGAVLDSSMRPDQLRQSLLAEHDKKRARCLEVAREHFNIEKFAGSYASFYRTED